VWLPVRCCHVVLCVSVRACVIWVTLCAYKCESVCLRVYVCCACVCNSCARACNSCECASMDLVPQSVRLCVCVCVCVCGGVCVSVCATVCLNLLFGLSRRPHLTLRCGIRASLLG